MSRISRLFLLFSFIFYIPSISAYAESTALEQKIQEGFEAGDLKGLHSIFIQKDGATLAELYFEGLDQNWGRSLGVIQHSSDSLHDLRSVTKTITSLLYGIALSEGLVPNVNESLIEQFPQYSDLASDPQRRGVTIAHALSMTMGTEWNETIPYTDPQNSEIAMERAKDRYRFILDRPMVHAPGTTWTYNGGATAIIAKLIEDGTGLPIEDYAKEKLLKPLGITRFEWVKGADGIASAASGLRLTLRDMTKIGQMVLDDGQFNNTQIVPKNWLIQSRTPHAHTNSMFQYGYFWWLGPVGSSPYWGAGFGNGGQRLIANTETKVLISIFAGNYNDPMAWQIPVKIVRDYMLPVLSEAKSEND